MNKPRILALISLGVFGLVLLCSRLDYARVQTGAAPLFSIEVRALKDGGSRIYIGPGYQLIRWHRLAQHRSQAGRETGTELLYFPLFKDWGFSIDSLEPGVPLEFTPQ